MKSRGVSRHAACMRCRAMKMRRANQLACGWHKKFPSSAWPLQAAAIIVSRRVKSLLAAAADTTRRSRAAIIIAASHLDCWRISCCRLEIAPLRPRLSRRQIIGEITIYSAASARWPSVNYFSAAMISLGRNRIRLANRAAALRCASKHHYAEAGSRRRCDIEQRYR